MQHTNAIIQLVVGGLMLFQFFKIKEKNKICFVIKKDPQDSLSSPNLSKFIEGQICTGINLVLIKRTEYLCKIVAVQTSIIKIKILKNREILTVSLFLGLISLD